MTNKIIDPDGFEIYIRSPAPKTKSEMVSEIRKMGYNRLEEAILASVTYGFVNLHTTNGENNKGDGKWYNLGSSDKIRHDNDPIMSLAQAMAMGVEIGS